MRIAALYDIHGNLPALEAVLDDVLRSKVDHLVIGGDVVTGPMPDETVDRLLQVGLPIQFIRGNADREALAQAAGSDAAPLLEPVESVDETARWVAKQLRPSQLQFISQWPETLRIDTAGGGEFGGLGTVLFCHATPRSDTEIFTRFTPEDRLLPMFEGVNVPLIICGHTHMPFDRIVGRVRIVNAGSVGMPYGRPGASWILLGTDVQFKHTLYDFARAAQKIAATDYPNAGEYATSNVLNPPTESEALDVFTQMELN